MVEIALTCLFFLLFLWAATHDFLTFRIPNKAVLGILLLGALSHLIMKDGSYTLKSILLTGGVLAVGFALYHFGLLGAGDVKLWSAATLWYGVNDAGFFCCAVALMGGVLASLYYFYGAAIQNTRHGILLAFEKKQKTGKYKYIFNQNILNLTSQRGDPHGAEGRTIMPYGVAIFWGAIITSWIKG